LPADQTRSAKPAPCPICGQPAVPRFAPFCSRRCADVDLGRWFGEAYRIPAEPTAPPAPEQSSGDE
jgi:endogenous inhibitor of DNA gyrase (YacG/DUF329 family)